MSCHKYNVLITCEHANNLVPTKYSHHFAPHQALLQTHRGYDIGAFSIAKKLSTALRCPFFFNDKTRLLVDVNRSLSSRTLFFLPLDKTEQDMLLCTYYFPYRKKVCSWIEKHHNVLHLSIHSFTPVLNGNERHCDIGLLYDPKKDREKNFCQTLAKELKKDYHVRNNYPYKGISDGFTTYLRKKYPKNYSGIEIEINQKLAGKQMTTLTRAILRTIHDR